MSSLLVLILLTSLICNCVLVLGTVYLYCTACQSSKSGQKCKVPSPTPTLPTSVLKGWEFCGMLFWPVSDSMNHKRAVKLFIAMYCKALSTVVSEMMFMCHLLMLTEPKFCKMSVINQMYTMLRSDDTQWVRNTCGVLFSFVIIRRMCLLIRCLRFIYR